VRACVCVCVCLANQTCVRVKFLMCAWKMRVHVCGGANINIRLVCSTVWKNCSACVTWSIFDVRHAFKNVIICATWLLHVEESRFTMYKNHRMIVINLQFYMMVWSSKQSLYKYTFIHRYIRMYMHMLFKWICQYICIYIYIHIHIHIHIYIHTYKELYICTYLFTYIYI